MKVNRLASSLSPYLLQHRHNPVDWYPWSQESLQRARDEERPIFLSIGYSACHWCHVMERESFQDQAIAAQLNQHFINIKVDREERPDLDTLYMTYLQTMTGRGGWPISIFITPDLKPFFAGTYFPPQSRDGRVGFDRVLSYIVDAWNHRRRELIESSQQLFQHLCEQQSEQARWRGSLSRELLEHFVKSCGRSYDACWGGFGEAPKFPQATLLFALLNHPRDDTDSLKRVTHTLEQMMRGGIYDQLGGGFHRYSVDRQWLVPHFEKMLYDNALLSKLCLAVYSKVKEGQFLDTALHTLEYLMREMSSPLGAFYSSEDADSEGQEGQFYLWSLAEVEEILPNAALFCQVYGVSQEGHFEGKNILHQVTPLRALSTAEWEQLSLDRQRLLQVRSRRSRPHLDDKVLVDWNGLAISSFAKAYQVTAEPRYLKRAQQAALFIDRSMVSKGQLYHLWRGTLGEIPGFLEDYANYIIALLDLYESDFDRYWLDRARQLLEVMIDLFWDSDQGGFYSTSSLDEPPLVRQKAFSDDATPAGNAQATLALLRLGCYFQSDRYGQMAEKTLAAHAAAMQKAPQWYGTMLWAAQSYLLSMQQIVVVGDREDKRVRQLLDVIYSEYLPHRVLALCDDRCCRAAEPLPICQGKASGRVEALVCWQGSCSSPTSDPARLRELLRVEPHY